MNEERDAAEAPARSGGQILVDTLRIQGVDTIFGVPGESALPVFDALHGDQAGIRFVVCRHEANAANMAEADSKLRNEPGVCLVSRGPGAMHAAIAVHTAFQDSTPLVLIVGQVPRAHRGREAFQEMDYTRVFADTTKWAAEITDPARIPEMVSRAFHTAMAGRRGPVVLSIPEDVLSATARVADVARYQAAEPAPSPAAMTEFARLLAAAERPLVIVGGSGWDEAACAGLARFARSYDLPVAAAFRCQDVLDNRSEHYVGDLSFGPGPGLARRVGEADLLVVIGDRLGDVTTRGYTLLKPPVPGPALVHVYPGAEELGRVYQARLAVHASVGNFVRALGEMRTKAEVPWGEWRKGARQDYVAFSSPAGVNAALDFAKIIGHVRATMPDDTMFANGAGNYAIWLHRYLGYRVRGTQLAPRSGAMGYGLPAAIAAKLRHPGRPVICFAGDGDFQMASPDFITAARYRLPIVVIIMNNGLYGSIRMHQERHYPGRPSGTSLENPDFVAFAEACGGYGERVTADADFPAAFERALAAGRPAILDLPVDPRRLTPDMMLDSL
ncbi:thiamine pyrophosphate-dependent enzyme [Propylenella binzhouense]|uniref:Thiamine pyrophosphate-binding protein n=1 Tax=Propylenella binzhouense TaxID=2555902 RepID=A0A964T646_9HYPH|nr:thiamine pyrophosphate-binding protein [Propylenella binzhouense]